MYRYILRESCSQIDSLPLTSLTIPLTSLTIRRYVDLSIFLAFLSFALLMTFFSVLIGREGAQATALRRGRHTLLRRCFRLVEVLLSEREWPKRTSVLARAEVLAPALHDAVAYSVLDPTQLGLSVSELDVEADRDGRAAPAAKRIGAGSSALARAAQRLCAALRADAATRDAFDAALSAVRLRTDERLHAVANESHTLEPARARWLIEGYRRLFRAGALGGAAQCDALGTALGVEIVAGATAATGECSFVYRYIVRKSCSQYESLP